jgi:hypothetical protein
MAQERAEANRINAQRSSGPRTELGKSRSKMNALKHGLSAKKIVIGDEDPKDFEELHAALERDFQPETALESELVEQLAGSLWRLRRVPAIEAAIVKAREKQAYSRLYSEIQDKTMSRVVDEIARRCSAPFADSSTGIERALKEEIKKGDLDSAILKQAQESRESELLLLIRDDDDMIEKLSRYQASLMNAANRAVQQLRLIKSMNGDRRVIAF